MKKASVMEELNEEKVFSVVIFAGEILLANGAEISRVEETMERIAHAYGLDNLETFVVANGLFATADGHEKRLFTKIKHIPTGSIHMGKIVAVNDLSRNIERQSYSVDAAYEKLEQVQKMPVYSSKYRILASGLGSCSFCILFGGRYVDAVVSFVIGSLLWIIIIICEKRRMSKAMTNILGSTFVSFLSLIAIRKGIGNSMDKIIIGAIIPMVPGVPFTNAIQDFVNNDYLSGTIRILDAILVAASIAIGVGITLGINRWITV